MGIRAIVPEALDVGWVSWVPFPKGWFKINFDSSMQGNKVVVGFVVRNDTGGLVGVGSVSLVYSSVLDVEI